MDLDLSGDDDGDGVGDGDGDDGNNGIIVREGVSGAISVAALSGAEILAPKPKKATWRGSRDGCGTWGYLLKPIAL